MSNRLWIDKPPVMDKDVAEKILIEVKDVLDTNDIQFYLMFGTLLGAVREGKFFDEDFDIDLCVTHQTLRDNLYSLNAQFRALGYNTLLLDTPYRYKRLLKLDKNDIRVDIVDFNRYGDYLFTPIGAEGDCEVFPIRLFKYNPIKISFCHSVFDIPSGYKDVLRLCYGDKWFIKDVNYDYRVTAKNLIPNSFDKIINGDIEIGLSAEGKYIIK